MFYQGKGVAQNDAQALQLFRVAADQGYAGAQNNLGDMFYNEKDYEKAARFYRLAADQGYTRAQVNLGNMFYHGRGVAQDNAEAIQLYLLAAEKGNTTAQSMLKRLKVDWSVNSARK
jgi:TPR repeat protein